MKLGIYGVAGRYSQAFYELAVDARSLDDMMAALNDLDTALTPELREFLSSPVYANKQKLQTLNAVLTKLKSPEMVKNFVGVVTSRGRASLLPQMIAGVRALTATRNGELKVSVTSAAKLTASQRKNIEAFVKAKHPKAKTISLDERLNPDLIAGVRVQVGSLQYDATLRGRLNGMAAQLMREAV